MPEDQFPGDAPFVDETARKRGSFGDRRILLGFAMPMLVQFVRPPITLLSATCLGAGGLSNWLNPASLTVVLDTPLFRQYATNVFYNRGSVSDKSR